MKKFRTPMRKRQSRRNFTRNSIPKKINFRPTPMRGGTRM